MSKFIIRKMQGRFTVAGFVVASAVSLIAALRMLQYILSSSANTPSNDEFYFIPLLDKMLSGHETWSHYLRDSFQGVGHSWGLILLIYAAALRFFGGNTFLLVSLGVGLALLEWVLTYLALSPQVPARLRPLLLAILGLLIFAPSQLAGFENHLTTFQLGLCRFGLALGICGLLRCQGSWLGMIAMGVGGLLASYSFGIGPLTWGIFLIALFFAYPRKIQYYAIWLILTITGTLPYLIYLPSGATAAFGLIDKVKLLATLIGWPFALSFSLQQASNRGICGVIFAVFLLQWIASTGKKELRKALGPLLFLAFGLFVAAFIAILRSQLWPHYARAVLPFWIGLTGAAFLPWLNPNTNWMRDKGKILSLCFFSILGYFYLSSNLSLEDKSSLLTGQSPASASCMRSYRSAPTYCEQYIFQWSLFGGRFLERTGNFFEKYQAGIFANDQEWALQGDFALNVVRIRQEAQVPGIFWTQGLEATSTPFSDHHHLNLFLHSPNSVVWTFQLPKHLKRAEFKTAVAISTSAPQDPKADGMSFSVKVVMEGGRSLILASRTLEPGQHKWVPLNVSLLPFKGKKVTLVLQSEPRENPGQDWGLWQYPQIRIETEQRTNDSFISANTSPSNVKNPDLPSPLGEKVLELVVNDPRTFATTGIIADSKDEKNWTLWNYRQDPLVNPSLRYEARETIRLRGDEILTFEVGIFSKGLLPLLEVLIGLQGENTPRSFYLPLLADGKRHTYSYDLKLLELGPAARLKSLEMRPISSTIPNEAIIFESRMVILERSP